MSQYDNTLKGALFVNDRKQSDNHPDYRGSIQDDTGREFWVSAWIKSPKSGNGPDFLSLSLTPKESNPSSRQAAPAASTDKGARDFLARNADKISSHRSAPAQPAPDYDSFDDDIPF